MKNNQWIEIQQEISGLLAKIENIIKIHDNEDEKEYWRDIKGQLEEAEREARQRMEQVQDAGTEVTRYAEKEFEDLYNDLRDMSLYLKENYDLGDSNETGQ